MSVLCTKNNNKTNCYKLHKKTVRLPNHQGNHKVSCPIIIVSVAETGDPERHHLATRWSPAKSRHDRFWAMSRPQSEDPVSEMDMAYKTVSYIFLSFFCSSPVLCTVFFLSSFWFLFGWIRAIISLRVGSRGTVTFRPWWCIWLWEAIYRHPSPYKNNGCHRQVAAVESSHNSNHGNGNETDAKMIS